MPGESRSWSSFLARPRLPVVLGGLFLATALLHLAQVAQTADRLLLAGNEAAHVRLVDAIVNRGEINIDPSRIDSSTYEGKGYSNKPPGFSFLMAPVYAPFAFLADMRSFREMSLVLKVSNALISATTVLFCWLFLETFGLTRVSITLGTAAATIGTVFPAYSSLANSIPLSLLLSITALLLVRLSALHPDRSRYGGLALLCCSYAVVVDYSNAFFLAPVAAVPLIDMIRRRSLRKAAWLAPALLPVVLILLYNSAAFGSPFALSYSYYNTPEWVPWESLESSWDLSRIPRGLYGLLFSPSRGLFLLSPVALLGLPVIWRWGLGRRWDRLWVAAAIGGQILALSAYELWHGGHSVGYRHILPAAMALAALTAFTFERWRRRRALFFGGLALLLVSAVAGVGSFFIQADIDLLRQTWKGEPDDVHSHFHTELLWPAFRQRLQ